MSQELSALTDRRGDSLAVTDSRTGKTYQIPIETGGVVRASALRQIKVNDEDPGLLSYDPALSATGSCRSAITFVDGDRGILRYRGYPIEQLAERSSFLEVAYLLMKGELPSREQLDTFVHAVLHRTYIHENVKKLIDGFHHNAHPMGILLSTVGGLATFHPNINGSRDRTERRLQMVRLIAKMPTLAAFASRHSRGLPYVYPDNGLSYTGNFLSMMWRMSESKYCPDPVLEQALDVLFILHADHEQNCSTNAMRAVGSSGVDPYSAAAAAVAALYGPLHGGANEQVLRMLQRIGSVGHVRGYVEQVKKGEFRLMGFGSRLYRNHDPRVKIVRKIADTVFKVTGACPLLEVAAELESTALHDDYFIERKLYPNVDFYTGLIYEAIGFPVEMFPVLFAIGRMPGWLAQWEEGLLR
jgi:citrate synthase